MAAAVKKRAPVAEPAELVVSLHAPGMTALLRAGAGGLAASLLALLKEKDRKAPWPSPVPLGPGSAHVEPTRITFSWGGQPPEQTLEALFQSAFRLNSKQLIELAGAHAHPPGTELAAALQEALKFTFLQHGSTTTKAGAARVETVAIDDKEVPVLVQGYSAFVHQEAWQSVATALSRGTTTLAGWAYPGAAERHIGLGSTKVEYTAAEALCACFSLVGCLSFKVPNLRAGALLIPSPADLVRFARVRPSLTPERVADVSVSAASDAMLQVQLELRMQREQSHEPSLEAMEAVTLRTLPWARQQKNRSGVLRVSTVPDAVLDQYETLASRLPSQVRIRQAATPAAGKGRQKKQTSEAPAESGFFITTSALRGFITDNLAAGRPWYEDFATATLTTGNKRRFIHLYRTRDNLGALFMEERKGLIAMLDHLKDAERVFVESVHHALRQRFGAIAEENKNNPTAMKNRMNGERERWRLAFAGAKTHEQVRSKLADLWSRAGSNKALREHWREVLPLLRADRWRDARDLALVALASYQAPASEDTDTQGDEALETDSE